MAEEKTKKSSYLRELVEFYFAPELRSVVTLLYLGIFGYFTLYYLDNVLLALRYLIYITFGHTALQGIAHLFVGMTFIMALALPFFLSFYSIFVLHRVWDKPTWSTYVKWLVTCAIIVGGISLIITSDAIARLSAKQDVMKSFVEDANLSGRL